MPTMDDGDDGGPVSHSERLKVEFAGVVDATSRAMKRYCSPGVHFGVAQVAALLGRDKDVMRNQFGPTSYDHAPTLHTFLQVIEALQDREPIQAIAELADCVTIPRSIGDVELPESGREALASLPDRLATVLSPVSEAAAMERMGAADRARVRDALMDGVALLAALLHKMRMP